MKCTARLIGKSKPVLACEGAPNVSIQTAHHNVWDPWIEKKNNISTSAARCFTTLLEKMERVSRCYNLWSVQPTVLGVSFQVFRKFVRHFSCSSSLVAKKPHRRVSVATMDLQTLAQMPARARTHDTQAHEGTTTEAPRTRTPHTRTHTGGDQTPGGPEREGRTRPRGGRVLG